MGRGRPRTRRIIARVILPRCAGSPFLSLSFRLAPLPRAFCLALTRAYVRTCEYVRTRELASARERGPSVRRSWSRGAAGAAGARGSGARGEQGKGVEALEEEVRGQPHSRRGRRDAHRATPTRKAFSTEPSSSSPSSFFSSASLPFFCPSFSPLARASSFASFRSRPRNAPAGARTHGFFFEPDCTLHIYRYRILRISTGILRHVLPSHQIIVRSLAGRLVARVNHKCGESC